MLLRFREDTVDVRDELMSIDEIRINMSGNLRLTLRKVSSGKYLILESYSTGMVVDEYVGEFVYKVDDIDLYPWEVME